MPNKSAPTMTDSVQLNQNLTGKKKITIVTMHKLSSHAGPISRFPVIDWRTDEKIARRLAPYLAHFAPKAL